MNALLIGALARARLAAKPVRKSAWSDDHRNPHTYAPHDAITREGVRALQTEGFLLDLSHWREEKTDHGLVLVANMSLWHGPSGLAWPMAPWREPLKGGENRSEAWHAAQVAARAYAHREVCSIEVLDESRAAGPAPAPASTPAASSAPVDGLSQEDRDAFARAVNAPTEEEERELRKAETESRLRADHQVPVGAMTAGSNGTTPHVDPEPTIPPHPAVAFDATTGKPPEKMAPCPVCRGTRAGVRVTCGGCSRIVCALCVPGDVEEVDGGPVCSECETAEENADCAPPHLSGDATAKARQLLAGPDHSLAEVGEAVGVIYLGGGPLGCLLKFEGAVFRLAAVDFERWLRGDLTVGLEQDEDQDEAGESSIAAPSPTPSTSPGVGSPKGEEPAEDRPAPAAPTPAGTSPAGSPSNPDEEAPGTSPGSSGCKTAASSPTPPSPGGASSPVGPNFLDQEEWSGVTNPEPSASSSSPEASSPAASPPGAPAVQSPAEASGGGAPLRCPDCLVDVPEVVGFVDHLGPCPSCETELRLVEGQPSWLEVPELLLGFLEHVPTKRKVKYGTRRGRSVTVAVHPGAGVDTVDVTDLRAWEEPEAPPAPKGKKEKPSKAPPGPVGIPEDEEQRKALGATWAPMKAHRATKKAPAAPCPLCEKPIVKGATYRAGNAALGKALVHDRCVFWLQEGRDPRLSPQAALEEDARRAMAAAGGGA